MRIGLTGDIGSGKSLIASIFMAHFPKEIKHFDTDKISKKLLNEDYNNRYFIEKQFGMEFISHDKIDFSKLGDMLFASPDKLKILEDFIQPQIIEYIKDNTNNGLINIIESAILFEKNWDEWLDTMIFAYCREPELTELRLQNRLLPKEKLDNIKNLQSSLSFEDKMKRSQFSIDNSYNMGALYGKIDKIMEKLREMQATKPKYYFDLSIRYNDLIAQWQKENTSIWHIEYNSQGIFESIEEIERFLTKDIKLKLLQRADDLGYDCDANGVYIHNFKGFYEELKNYTDKLQIQKFDIYEKDKISYAGIIKNIRNNIENEFVNIRKDNWKFRKENPYG